MKESHVIKPFGKPDDPLGFYHLLQQHINWLAIRNFSTSTLKKRITYVRAFAMWCSARDVDSPLPKLPRSLPKAVLTHAEVENVMQQPDTTSVLGLRDRALLETLYSTGINRAEVCGLRLDHIHVDRQVLYIHRGKGQKDRYVPIGVRALTWIARYVEQAREKLLETHARTHPAEQEGEEGPVPRS